MEDVISELRVVTIPAGTAAHLFDWKAKKISDQHFVLTGDTDVLVRRDYGPVYSLLEKHLKKGDLLDDMKEYVMDLYKGGGVAGTHAASVISDLGDVVNEVDAVLMAIDGRKIGLVYLHMGEDPDIDSLC
jgi:reverse gyrase